MEGKSKSKKDKWTREGKRVKGIKKSKPKGEC